MIEVEKYLFDQMVGYVNGISKFVSAVSSNELRKASAIRAELHEQRESAKNFSTTLQRKSSSPASAASARAMAGLKKPLRDLIKNLDAIDTGIENGELNLTKFRAAVRSHIKPTKDKLVQIGEKFAPSGVTDEDLKKEVKFASQTKGHRDALKILKNAAKQLHDVDPNDHEGAVKALRKGGKPEDEASEEIDDKEARKLVAKYSKFRAKLPSSLKGKLFQLVEMPLVPFGDFRLMTPSFLRKTGIDFHYIAESFPVLEKQYLLAFDHSQATAYKGRKDALKTQGLKARKRAAAHQTMQELFVFDIIDRINEVATEEYTLVSSHFEFHPHNPRIAYAWLMPKRSFRVFERAGDMAKFQWGFPWSREAASVL